jgi:uncharacterized membrane protein
MPKLSKFRISFVLYMFMRLHCDGLHGVIYQKMKLFIITEVLTIKLTLEILLQITASKSNQMQGFPNLMQN